MTPEELAAIKSSSDWRSTIGRLLSHIDQQAAQIEALKAALDEVKLDRVNFSSACQEQIEALKEKLITETAYHLYYKCQGDCCRMICSAGSHKEEARQQLKAEMPEVGWE